MIFDGKKLAEEVKASLRDRIAELGKQYGRVPCLSVLLVGDDYGSQRYVASCEKNAALIGMTCRVVRMEGDSSEDDVLRAVETLNADNTVDHS